MQQNNTPKGPGTVGSGEGGGSTLVCAKCGANKVAHSRPKGLDNLYMRFVPRSPYRCMRCYSRFWKSEGLFDNRKRVWTLGLIVCAAIALSVYLTMSGQSKAGSQNSTSDSNVVNASSDSNEESGQRAFEDPLREAARQAAIEDQLALADIKPDSSGEDVAATFAARMSKSLSPDRAELESLAKVEVSYLVEQWRNAWEAGVSDVYLSYYSDKFTPGSGQSLTQWQKQRRLRVVPSKNIELALEDFNVSFDDDIENSTVTFGQLYRSGDYSERSRKQLVLSKEQEVWKIISEAEIN